MNVKLLIIVLGILTLTGCSVFGDSGVESAPYKVIKADEAAQIEVRNYESMILVSAKMGEGRNSAFRQLFNYITGDNQGATDIAMTAPVFMNEKDNEGTEIAMTAPVFMDENNEQQVMSFVMPASFTMETTPKPTNPDVWVSEVTDYKVVAIKFSGLLSDSNIEENEEILLNWLQKNGYEQKGPAITAGYNGPLTIPMFRHNEVLIEIN